MPKTSDISSTNATVVRFIEAVKGLMHRRRITARELAIRLGKSESHISQQLNNYNDMRGRTMHEYATALGFTDAYELQKNSEIS